MNDNLTENSLLDPKYTKNWLALQIVCTVLLGFVLTAITLGISSFAGRRMDEGLLGQPQFNLIGEAANYCFAVIVISLMSVTLIELAFRKGANIIQCVLIGCALCLFYLLLLSLSEHIPFWAAYIIVSLMTISLISWFINAITRTKKATKTIAAILTVEYAVMLLLVYLGSMVLLVGSVLLFALIALAMYLTLRLKVDNEELILK